MSVSGGHATRSRSKAGGDSRDFDKVEHLQQRKRRPPPSPSALEELPLHDFTLGGDVESSDDEFKASQSDADACNAAFDQAMSLAPAPFDNPLVEEAF
jgi:hypothetical protein